jgi:hypothetical protein
MTDARNAKRGDAARVPAAAAEVTITPDMVMTTALAIIMPTAAQPCATPYAE